MKAPFPSRDTTSKALLVIWLVGLVYCYPKPLLTYMACAAGISVAVAVLNIAINRFIYKERGWHWRIG
jgi:hypothetical protein